jgi:putative ABC transport system permease protein
MLAGANARANLRRVASVATPLMLAVSLVCTIYFGKTILQQQTTEQTARRTTADYVLRAQDAPGLPADTARAARLLQGVAQASGSFPTSVIVAADGTNLRSFPARAVDASTLAGVIDLGVTSGSLKALQGRTLGVSTDSAKLFGWHTGDDVTVRLGDGASAILRVVVIYNRPLGFGDVVLPRSLAKQHVTESFDDTVFVRSAPGTDRRALASGLTQLARANPAIEITTRSQYESELEGAGRRQSLAVYVLLGLIVVFCALAVVNAVTMSTAERAREFALLRLIGAGKEQVRTMVRAETLIMLTFGLTIGTLIAIPGLAVLSHDLTGSATPSVSLRLYGGLVAFYTLLGFAAGVVPTRLALRADPVKAMAARE